MKNIKSYTEYLNEDVNVEKESAVKTYSDELYNWSKKNMKSDLTKEDCLKISKWFIYKKRDLN